MVTITIGHESMEVTATATWWRTVGYAWHRFGPGMSPMDLSPSWLGMNESSSAIAIIGRRALGIRYN